MVRHPLYLANWFIVLALALFPHTWLAPPVVASIAAGYYACIAKREEAFLRQQFGTRFEEWAARVPAFIPRVSLYVSAQRTFDLSVVGRREFYGLAVILVTPLPIEMIEHLVEHGALALDPIWVTRRLWVQPRSSCRGRSRGSASHSKQNEREPAGVSRSKFMVAVQRLGRHIRPAD